MRHEDLLIVHSEHRPRRKDYVGRLVVQNLVKQQQMQSVNQEIVTSNSSLADAGTVDGVDLSVPYFGD